MLSRSQHGDCSFEQSLRSKWMRVHKFSSGLSVKELPKSNRKMVTDQTSEVSENGEQPFPVLKEKSFSSALQGSRYIESLENATKCNIIRVENSVSGKATRPQMYLLNWAARYL